MREVHGITTHRTVWSQQQFHFWNAINTVSIYILCTLCVWLLIQQLHTHYSTYRTAVNIWHVHALTWSFCCRYTSISQWPQRAEVEGMLLMLQVWRGKSGWSDRSRSKHDHLNCITRTSFAWECTFLIVSVQFFMQMSVDSILNSVTVN